MDYNEKFFLPILSFLVIHFIIPDLFLFIYVIKTHLFFFSMICLFTTSVEYIIYIFYLNIFIYIIYKLFNVYIGNMLRNVRYVFFKLLLDNNYLFKFELSNHFSSSYIEECQCDCLRREFIGMFSFL